MKLKLTILSKSIEKILIIHQILNFITEINFKIEDISRIKHNKPILCITYLEVKMKT